jgi:hypothetical protein
MARQAGVVASGGAVAAGCVSRQFFVYNLFVEAIQLSTTLKIDF